MIKKIVELLILLCCFSMAANADTFDHSKLSGSQMYEYDEFADTWKFQVLYQKQEGQHLDAIGLCALSTGSKKLCVFYTGLEQSGFSDVNFVKKVIILADETRLTFQLKNDEEKILLDRTQFESFSKAILNAKEVRIRFYGDKQYTYTLTDEELDSETGLRKFFELLDKSGALDYYAGNSEIAATRIGLKCNNSPLEISQK